MADRNPPSPSFCGLYSKPQAATKFWAACEHASHQKHIYAPFVATVDKQRVSVP